MTNQQKWKKLAGLLEEIEVYHRCLGKMQFDMECCAPEEGIAPAGEDIAILGKQVHRLTHAKPYEKLIVELHADAEGLTPVQKKAVEHLYDHWAKEKNITPELSFEMDMAASHAYSDWLTAKQSADFSKFRDSLAALIKYQRVQIDLRDEHPEGYYNTCLDDMEKGGSEQ